MKKSHYLVGLFLYLRVHFPPLPAKGIVIVKKLHDEKGLPGVDGYVRLCC